MDPQKKQLLQFPGPGEYNKILNIDGPISGVSSQSSIIGTSVREGS